MKKLTKEILAYLSLLFAGCIIIYAIDKGADLMAVGTAVATIAGFAWNYVATKKRNKQMECEHVSNNSSE